MRGIDVETGESTVHRASGGLVSTAHAGNHLEAGEGEWPCMMKVGKLGRPWYLIAEFILPTRRQGDGRQGFTADPKCSG